MVLKAPASTHRMWFWLRSRFTSLGRPAKSFFFRVARLVWGSRRPSKRGNKLDPLPNIEPNSVPISFAPILRLVSCSRPRNDPGLKLETEP